LSGASPSISDTGDRDREFVLMDALHRAYVQSAKLASFATQLRKLREAPEIAWVRP
jgi:hypothetical protein